MKSYLNKNAKRALSLVLSIAMLIGTLFVANVGVNIDASAQTAGSGVDFGNVVYLENASYDPVEPTQTDGVYVIDTVEKLAWVCTKANAQQSAGKTYRVADGIDTFVLQTKNYINSIGGLSALAAMSADELKTTFETKTSGVYNWNTSTACFSGNFDGNGVAVYGMYAAGSSTQAGLFPMVDGGECGTSSTEYIIATYGSSIKNIAVRNSYVTGKRWIGALIGTSNYQAGGAFNYGWIEITACEVSNCVIVGKRHSSNEAMAGMGFVTGSIGNDPATIERLLVCGNKAWFIEDDGTVIENAFNNITSGNNKKEGTVGDEKNIVYGKIRNSILVGAKINDTSTDNRTNVNTFTDIETIRGGSAMLWNPEFAWGTDWYAIEGDLPTPVKPDNYIASTDTSAYSYYSDGNGTKEKPYIIRTVDQLDKMVADGGINNGVKSYYKVADDVKKLYINDVNNYEEVVQLVASGAYNNWLHNNTIFQGHFDGNGVTIYGLVSTTTNSGVYVGFVPVFGSADEIDVTIKNVVFAAAYVKAPRAGTLASNVQSWSVLSTQPHSYITNVAVIESHTEATYNNNTYDSNDNGTNFNAATPSHTATAGGILLTQTDPDHINITNCLYDGGSSVLKDGDAGDGASENSAKAGIVGMSSTGNEISITNCISIDEYLVPMATVVANVSSPYLLDENRTVIASGSGYRRYLSADMASSVHFKNCYSVFNSNMNKVVVHDLLDQISSIANKSVYTQEDAVLLDWVNTWTLVALDDGRTIPMPIGLNSKDIPQLFSQKIASLNNNTGANALGGRRNGYASGTYGMYHTYTGSGTASDPYLIDTPLKLAQAIGCGGKNINQKLYYKLVCDIDLTGDTWIDQVTIKGKYVYVPFEGTLDGANYTITGLSAVDGESAGLIPVLNGGTVKNVHIRDSYAGSNGKAGLIAGTVNAGSTVENCSVEGSLAKGIDSSTIFGNWGEATTNAEISNCYIAYEGNAQYVLDTEQVKSVNDITDIYSSTNTGAAWYKGPDGVARHMATAKAHTVTDVDGDGVFGNMYTTTDVVALRRNLLKEDGYLNIYGDVNSDGKVNITDLVTIRREMVDDRNDIRDGFWRNLEVRKFSIYYGSNDNYDAARKLELGLESMIPGLDIKKVVSANSTVEGSNSDSNAVYVHSDDEVGTPDGEFEFIVGNIANYSAYATNTIATAPNTYAVDYNSDKHVVWLQGANFTAVEQAVIEFLANTNAITGDIYTTGSKSLAPEKVSKTYNGTTYYYSWGDEFNTSALDGDAWGYGSMHNETTHNEDDGGVNRFANLEVAFPEDMAKLYSTTENSGHLTISRGYYADSTNATANSIGWKWLGKLSDKGVTADMSGTTDKKSVENEDYVSNNFGGRVESTDTFATAGLISTYDSVLAKQGYLEMRATYPSDGHVFACWWLMGFNGTQQNSVLADSLYGKVFKLNNSAAYSGNTSLASQYAWNGSEIMNSSNPATFKYQLPNSTFEIDIVELMQADKNAKNTYKVANYTFHKFYRNGVYEDGGVKKIKFIDWDNLLLGKSPFHSVYREREWSRGGLFSSVTAGDYGYFSSGATKIDEFLYNTATSYTSTTTEKGAMYDKAGYYTWNGGLKKTDDDAGPYFSGTPGYVNVEGGTEYIFGVEWKSNGNGGTTIAFTVKKASDNTSAELVNDGGATVASGTMTINNTDFEEKSTAFLENLTQLESDAETMNQYMYMLIDNTYYTSTNSEGSSPYSDLLTAKDPSGNSGDTTQMIIDYVRIYQSKRDLVTNDTEYFNNGNHFGY